MIREGLNDKEIYSVEGLTRLLKSYAPDNNETIKDGRVEGNDLANLMKGLCKK